MFLGSFGANFIAIGALVSILGNLNGGFLAATRIPFAMAEQNEIPQIIGKIHQKFKTPYISLFITATLMLILTIQSSFVSALTIATITRLIVYATTCASLPVFRYKSDAPQAKFITPFARTLRAPAATTRPLSSRPAFPGPRASRVTTAACS